MKKAAHGFTLVELLIIIALVVIFAAVIMVIVNPVEMIKRSRDATRVSDLGNLRSAIITALSNSTDAATTLCHNLSFPCTDLSTSAGARNIDGTGWIKVNLAAQSTVTVSVLPVDPVNDSTNFYTYYSDGVTFELNAILESGKYESAMWNDGGDNDNVYEVGSSLVLLN